MNQKKKKKIQGYRTSQVATQIVSLFPEMIIHHNRRFGKRLAYLIQKAFAGSRILYAKIIKDRSGNIGKGCAGADIASGL